MVSPIDAQINILINTQQATAQLRSLQASINSINKNLAATSDTAIAQQARINKALVDGARASGMWEAKMVPATTAMHQFSDSLDRGKMSLGEYTRYAASAMPGMSRIFKSEFEMMTRVAEDRVKRMQTQFVNLGNSANGVGNALALTPKALDQYGSAAAIATQRQAMMNRMIDLGSTKLLNWGKNTQWAGRQLMVGFSIPLAMMGAASAKAFKEIDQSSIAFRRVYGDLQTTTAEMENNLDAVKQLGMEYTKYGQSLASTIDLAAKVAATGAENQTLMAATEQTMRLSTLGMMEYGEAMDATIALQTAFQVSNEDLASTIDFLNVVENQTILSMQDMAAAIPRVAPVIRGLGGDVKDLAVFMTAMREGGISAEQGANALKSGLGRLINPTKAAKEMLTSFGISIDSILQKNKGDLMGMVKDFGEALSTLGEFEQQQVLQKVFGTYQYARLGALFKNIANDAGQAQRTIELTSMSIEDLAKISEKELGKIEEATSTKFAASLERLKVAIAPVGEMFMKVLMPIIDRVADIANAFNDLPSGIKKAIAVVLTAIGGIAPVLIMVTGLFGNAIANSIKFVQFMRKLFARIKGTSDQFNLLTNEEIEAKGAADALSGSTETLTTKFLGQGRALVRLNSLLSEYKIALLSIPTGAPIGNVPVPIKGAGPLRAATGGMVPGRGNKDTVPALLTPGESVINKKATKQYAPILDAMNKGTLPGFNLGILNLFKKLKTTETFSRAAKGGAQSYTALRQALFPKEMKALGSKKGENAEYQIAPSLIEEFAKIGGFSGERVPQPKHYQYMATAHVKPKRGKSGGKLWNKGGTRFTSYAENDIVEKLFGTVGGSEQLRTLVRSYANHPTLNKRVISRILSGKHPTTTKEYEETEKLLSLIKSDPSFNNLDELSRVNVAILDGISKVRIGKASIKGLAESDPYGVFTGPALTLAGLEKSFSSNQLPLPPVKGFAKGMVPGKGNKDTIPALLTPGESVITKEATSKFGPILEAMNQGRIKGFAEGDVQIDGEDVRYRDDPSKPVRSHGTAPIPITPEQLAEYQAQTKNQALKEATSATGLSSWIYGEPQLANDKLLTGIERGGLFAGGAEGSVEAAMRAQIMQPLEEAVRRFDPDQLVNDPDIKRLSSRIADNMATGLTEVGVGIVDDQIFQQIDERAFREALEAPIYGKTGTEKLSSAQQEAIQRARTTTTALVVSGPRGKSRVSVPGGLSYKNISMPETGVGITPFLTPEGNEQRRRIAEEKAARRAQYTQSARSGATTTATPIPTVSTRSDIRQLLKEIGVGPLVKEEQDARKENIRLEREREKAIRKQMMIMSRGGMSGQVLGLRERAIAELEKQAAQAQSTTATTGRQPTFLGMPKVRQDIEEEPKKRFGKMSEAISKFSGKITTAGSAAGMGLMGLSMAASFAGGTIGEMAQSIMPLAGILTALPLLANPVGLAVAAIGGLTAGFIYLRKQLDDTAIEAARMGANIGGVANGMKVLEEATGFKPPALEDRLFRFTEEDRAAMTEFGSYFQSETGSKFIQDLKNATSEERYQKVSKLLAQGIASGLPEDKAKAFGFAIAEATGDALLKSGLSKDFANQVFKSGSQVLINLEKERINTQPNLSKVPMNYQDLSQRQRTNIERKVEIPTWQKILDFNLSGKWISTARLPIISDLMDALPKIPMVTTTFTQAAAEAETVLKPFAEGLGFALQTVQNLTNAEAVLEEERRKGLINFPEYEKRLQELTNLQQKNADYIGQIFSSGADSGAMMKALEDQLSFANFTEDQIKRISERFSPDALAQQFFQKDFKDPTLTKDQKDYVEQVFTRIMSGLTPENIDQRLQDVEGTYATMANKVVQSMMDATFKGLDFSFNTQNITDFIQQRMGGGLTAGKFGMKMGGASAETLASNLMGADQDLKKIGTDALEVFTRLSEFTNVDFAKGIMASQDEILKFGDAVVKLSKYEKIKLELVMTGGYDPDKIVSTIEQINNMRIDPKIFGAVTFDAQDLVASLIDAGVELDDLDKKFRDGVIQIEKFGKKAVDSMGNIKPEIVPKVIANVFGDQVSDPQGIANALNSAFPDGLKPIDLAILLTLSGDPAALALLSNPAAIAAAKQGKTAFQQNFAIQGMGRGTAATPIPASLTATMPYMAGGAKATGDGKKDAAGGGGAKSFLQSLKEEIQANLKIFVQDITGGVGGAVQRLRNLKIPEQLIEAMGAGPEGYKNMKEFLGQSAKQRNKLISDYFKSLAGQQISELIGQKRVDKATAKSADRLRAEGFDSERIGQILSNPAVAETLASLKVGSPQWERYINNLKSAEAQSQKTAKALDPMAFELDKISKEFDDIMAPLKAMEAEFQMRFGEIERAYKPRIDASQKVISDLEKQIALIEEEIAAIEKLNNADQNRIRGLERQKEMIGRQIEELDKQNERDQRRIDTLQRQDELRNREADALNHELDVMSDIENKIRDSYQKRIESLDKVAELNTYIADQQRQQLGLSKAISEGDIYAATAAAQEMRQSQAEFAQQQARAGLQQGMENAIAGLTTSGGLTRDQAEEKIRQIKEQSYQTSLLIRDIEDDIYQRNLDMIPLKDHQRDIDRQIRDIQDAIYDRETNIIKIQNTRLAPLQTALTNENKKLASLQEQMETEKSNVEVQGIKYDQLMDQIGAQQDIYDWTVAQIRLNKDNAKSIEAIGKNWRSVAKQINEVNKAARDATKTAAETFQAANLATENSYNQGLISKEEAQQQKNNASTTYRDSLAAIEKERLAKVAAIREGKFYAGGRVPGKGGMDTTSAKLTPGEFVIRKAMVNKYGTSMLDSINQGSFTMPKFNERSFAMPKFTMPENQPNNVSVQGTRTSTSTVNAPMYNTYDMKFSISGTSANADEIANKVMFKIKQMQNQGIRGNRGR